MAGIDANALLVLNFNGSGETDGGTSTTDISQYGRTVTFAGNAVIDDAQSKFGGLSLLLDAVNDNVNVPDSTDFNFGTGDFTLELFIRWNTLVLTTGLIDVGNGISTDGAMIRYGSVNARWEVYCSTAEPFGTTLTDTPSADTWYHIAVSRVSGTIYFFKDGTQLVSAVSNSTNITCDGTVKIGSRESTTESLGGWIDSVRISNVGRYAANFTPTTSEWSVSRLFPHMMMLGLG